MSDYLIFSGDIPAAEWVNNRLTVLNKALLPLYLSHTADADSWLVTRAIDAQRTHARRLKEVLRLDGRDDASTALYVNGAVITDNYWVKPLDSALTYKQVRFTDDSFADLALTGECSDSVIRAAASGTCRTPELTNIGSYEKCRRLIDGQWWLYKQADHDEQFSELFVYEFGCALGLDMAHYERVQGGVRTRDFTDGASVNFEPAAGFMGDNEDYNDVLAALQEICPQAIPNYIRMIFLDAVTANPDRHTFNFGLLRDTVTGDLLGLAPLFDHNAALIARGYPSAPPKPDMLIRLFNDVMKEHPEYRQYVPVLTEQTVREVIDRIGMEVRTQAIVDMVVGRYALICLPSVEKFDVAATEAREWAASVGYTEEDVNDIIKTVRERKRK